MCAIVRWQRVLPGLMLVMAVAAIGAEDPSRLPLDKLTCDDWYGVYTAQGKAGHIHIQAKPVTGDGKSLFEVRMDGSIAAQLGNVKAEMKLSLWRHFEGQSPWTVVRSESIMDRGAMGKRTIRGQRVEKGYEVTTLSEGGKQTQVVPLPGENLPHFFAITLACLNGAEAGYVGHALDWDEDILVDKKQRFEFVRIEHRVLEGVKTEFVNVRKTDEDGNVQELVCERRTGRVVQGVLGGMFTLRLEPEAIAKDVSAVRNWVLSERCALDKPLGYEDPRDILGCTLFLPGIAPSEMKGNPRVKVSEVEGGLEATVVAGPAEAVPGKGDATAPGVAARFLEESPGIQSKDPAIQTQAHTIVEGAASEREKAERIVRWVYSNLEKVRSFDDDALTVLPKKQGDCSEHARLTVALARATGIPAEEIQGLMYSGDREGTMGAHAWVRLFVDGAWVEMDPTWNQTDVDGTHLELSTGACLKLQANRIGVRRVTGDPDVTMRFCPNGACGKPALAESWSFCPHCGRPLPSLPADKGLRRDFAVAGLTYKNKRLNFQIEAPNVNWRIVTATEQLKGINPLATLAMLAGNRYTVVILEHLPDMPLEKYAEFAKPKGSLVKKLSEEKTRIHDQDAIKRRWSLALNGVPVVFHYTVLAHGEYRCQVVGWCAAGDETPEVRTELQAIQDSFRPLKDWPKDR
jgi:hypothetical protein